jgi:circadian clock protein KaiC
MTESKGRLSARDRSGGQRGIRTGVTGLDSVLRGGIPQYAVVIIAGQPGSGKTILSQQILFNNASPDRPCVYLTTLSESPMKATRYMSQFGFFDAAKFGSSIIYMDIGQIMRSQGLAKSLDSIMDTLRESQPAIVVIDSFKAIHDLASSTQEMRTFVYDLAIEVAAMQSTSFLVGEYDESEISTQPEFAVADGIIWLYSQPSENQLSRYLRVLKMRGVDFSAAPQSFGITRDGIQVFATEELTEGAITAYGDSLTQTGLDELDDLLRGGIPSGAPMLVSGGAGSGKTTLCLQYLYEGATRYGEPGVYVSYEEDPAQIVANARRFGWDLQRLIDSGLLTISYTPLPKINAAEQLVLIRDLVRDSGAKRAVIDSLTMMLAHDGTSDLIRSHVYTLTTILQRAGCTALITSDPPIGAQTISRYGVEESIIDGVILLKLVGQGRARVRYLEIYKMRGVSHASGDNIMKITPSGIVVFPRVEEVR